MFDGGSPIPPGFPEYIPGRLESFIDLFLAFWIFFGLVLLILPRSWSDAVIETAFPFLPKPNRRS